MQVGWISLGRKIMLLGKIASSVSTLSKEIVVVLVLSLLPVLALNYTLVATGIWSVSIDAWRGKFDWYGLFYNPWLDFLPMFFTAELGFILLSYAGLTVVRHIKLSSPIYRLRLVIGLALTLLGVNSLLCIKLVCRNGMQLVYRPYIWMLGASFIPAKYSDNIYCVACKRLSDSQI